MKMGDEYIQKKMLKEATGTMNGLDSLFHYFKTVNSSNIYFLLLSKAFSIDKSVKRSKKKSTHKPPRRKERSSASIYSNAISTPAIFRVS